MGLHGANSGENIPVIEKGNRCQDLAPSLCGINGILRDKSSGILMFLGGSISMHYRNFIQLRF